MNDLSPGKVNFKNIPVQAGVISNIINVDIMSHNCFRELDDLVSSDQGVASLVLRVVNSALYSRGNKVATIPLAISLLGFSVVRSLALLAFSRSLFSHTRNAQFRLHIWQHSLLTAIASQSICEKLGHAKLADEAFIAGLMHDTGKVLMFNHNPALYEQVFQQVFENGTNCSAAEHQLFGFDHCEVGLEAVKEWKLPAHFNGYMGTDIALPQPATLADNVLLCLTAANFLVEAAGIGASQLEDQKAKEAKLASFGLAAGLCEELVQPGFIAGLMEHDIYKLCATV